MQEPIKKRGENSPIGGDITPNTWGCYQFPERRFHMPLLTNAGTHQEKAKNELIGRDIRPKP